MHSRFYLATYVEWLGAIFPRGARSPQPVVDRAVPRVLCPASHWAPEPRHAPLTGVLRLGPFGRGEVGRATGGLELSYYLFVFQ
jgi:hypothetical protein